MILHRSHNCKVSLQYGLYSVRYMPTVTHSVSHILHSSVVLDTHQHRVATWGLKDINIKCYKNYIQVVAKHSDSFWANKSSIIMKFVFSQPSFGHKLFEMNEMWPWATVKLWLTPLFIYISLFAHLVYCILVYHFYYLYQLSCHRFQVSEKSAMQTFFHTKASQNKFDRRV